MGIEENKAIKSRWYEEVFNKRNLTMVDEFIHPDWVGHSPDGQESNLEDLKQEAAMMLAAFPDLHITLEDIIAEDDKVVTRCTNRGTHTGGDYRGIAPTGKQFNMSSNVISRIKGGKIVECWGIDDQLGMMQQLGVIPTN